MSVTSSQSFVPKKYRTSTFQKSFFIRTTRIWNMLITRLDLDNVTFENFKSVLYSCYFYIFLFFGSAVIGFSCCGVPALTFKL